MWSKPTTFNDPFGSAAINPTVVWWSLKIATYAATTWMAVDWTTKTPSSLSDIVGKTLTDPVDSTSFSADPSGKGSGPACPSGGPIRKALIDITATRWFYFWPNRSRRIKINLEWEYIDGSIVGSLDSDGSSGNAARAGFKVMGVSLEASRKQYECDCFKYVPCVNGSVTVRVAIDQPFPTSDVFQNYTAKFKVCGDGSASYRTITYK
jgi:hypothetical protein